MKDQRENVQIIDNNQYCEIIRISFLSGLECIYIKARGISYLCGIINGSLIIFFSVENYLNEIHSQALQAATGVNAIPTGAHIRDDEQVS